MIIFLRFSVILRVLLLILYFIITNNKPEQNNEKISTFECGFEPLSINRMPHSTRFFILVALFLVFDIEVALLFPVLNILYFSSVPYISVFLLGFLTILFFGLLHEWNQGALSWVCV